MTTESAFTTMEWKSPVVSLHGTKHFICQSSDMYIFGKDHLCFMDVTRESVSFYIIYSGSLEFVQETTSMHAVDHSSLCTKTSAVIL